MNESTRHPAALPGNEPRIAALPPDAVIEREATTPKVRDRTLLSRLGSLSFYEKLFFAYVIATLGIMIFFVPPFMKADEPAHFHRAISLTNLDFVCTADANGNYYFEMKRKWIEAPIEMHVWDVWIYRDVKFDTSWLKTDFSDPKYDESVNFYEDCNLPPAGYLPTALGVLAGKPFENPLISLYLGRIAGAAFFFVALIIALRLAPPHYRPILYLFGGLPTVLHQVSAVSYDPVHLSLFAIIFALITKFAVEDRLIKPAYLLAFIGAILWAMNIRLLSYTPLILLLAAVRPANIAPDFSRYLRVIAGAGGGILLITAAFDLLYLPRIGTGYSPEGINAPDQLRFIVNNPFAFLAASYETISHEGDWLFRQGIGVFGWTDTPLAFFAFYGVTFVAGIIVYRVFEREDLRLGLFQTAALLLAVGLTVVSLFVSLYAVWSPVGGDIVLGLQGRYFAGLVPFAVLGLAQLAARIGKMRFVRIAIVIGALLLFVNIINSIDVRYYG